MRYLCLVHFDPHLLATMDPTARAELDRRSIAYDDELRQRGHYLSSDALQPPDGATLVRRRSGSISVTDGPFAETKEQVGGFILIDARDLNAAVEIAAGIPMAELGTIEVRPIQLLESAP